MDKSIREFAHLLLWALKVKAPITTSPEEIEEWAAALDVGTDPWVRPHPGALKLFVDPADTQGTLLERVRRGYQRRLVETPGVVATIGAGEHVDCSIYVRGILHKAAQVTEENFRRLRGDGTDVFPGWVLPGETELDDGKDVWRHALELALGCHYEWDPPAPQEWLEARREWGAYVRETIGRSRTYDSELHVALAVDAGKLDDAGRLARWRQVEPTFKPHVVCVWHEDTALRAVADWMRRVKGLVWTEHGFFAAKLSELSGVPYYGAGGFDAEGRYIEDHKPGTPAIASIDANREGKNLQGIWSDNLIVCPPGSGAWLEQLIARTHRPGQRADQVTVDVLLGCRENFDAITKAIDSARATQDMTGKRQKILMADISLPSESELPKTPRWVK